MTQPTTLPTAQQQQAMPSPDQVVGFADGLLKIKNAQAQGKGVDLDARQVDGLLWAIKQLRGAVRDAANPA